VRINYSVRNQNGAGLWVPPNPTDTLIDISRPRIYVQDSVQKHPIGTIAKLDQRKFAYCKAGAAITGIARLLIDASYIPSASGQTDVDGFEGECEAAAAGSYDVVIKDTTDRVANYYAGGYFTAFNADGIKTFTMRINGSDVAVSVDTVTLHLDDPIPWALVDGDFCDAYRSPYVDVTLAAADGFESFVALSHIAVTSGNYFWGQISGPAWIAQSAAATIPGYTVDKRDAFAWRDGTCIVGSTAGTLQRIGYALGKSVATTGDTYVMLQLG